MSVSKDQINALKGDIKGDGIQKVVVGAVICRDDLVLFLKRCSDDFMGGLVELPSGTVDDGEDIIDALKRETLEETGLNIGSIDSFIDTFDYVSGSGKKARQLNFAVSAREGAVKLNPDEHTQYYWLNPNTKEFESLNISEETKRTVKTATNA